MTLPASVRRLLPYVAVVLFVVGFANFGWFFIEAQAFGGRDALNGYQVDVTS